MGYGGERDGAAGINGEDDLGQEHHTMAYTQPNHAQPGAELMEKYFFTAKRIFYYL
jgi:hypothetical protein